MSARPPPSHRRIAAIVRAPTTWIGLALVLAVAAATTAVGVELYASTSRPMVVNSR